MFKMYTYHQWLLWGRKKTMKIDISSNKPVQILNLLSDACNSMAFAITQQPFSDILCTCNKHTRGKWDCNLPACAWLLEYKGRASMHSAFPTWLGSSRLHTDISHMGKSHSPHVYIHCTCLKCLKSAKMSQINHLPKYCYDLSTQ